MTIKFRAKTRQGWTVDSQLTAVTFPDGAVHIAGVDSPTKFEAQIAWVTGLDHSDLFTLAMWAEACSERLEKAVLVLPYLPGARMDRGTPEGAKVYADFLGHVVAPTRMITLDPHSAVALETYETYMEMTGISVFPVERIIRKEIQDPTQDEKADTYVGVIAPDAGALVRATNAARAMGVPVYRAEKSRDFATGKLSGFHMLDELPSEGRLLIMDDLLDAGGTFKGLSSASGLGPDRVDLWVTHMIGNRGLSTFRENFGAIYTTDSYYTPDSPYYDAESVESGFVTVIPLVKYLSADINSSC